MKILFILLLLVFCGNGIAQNVKNTYNTTIKSANKVTIKNEKGSTVIIQNIRKVEMAKVIVPKKKEKSRVLLKEMVQVKDSLGVWTTSITFKNPDKETDSEKINIAVQCKSQINSAKWGYGGGISVGFAITETTNLETGNLEYTAGRLSAGSTLILVIKSNIQIKPTIYGTIDG